jgi:pyruvate carboxylase subunit B
MMKEEGWDAGQDDEELFELAMHERQYRDYRSGIAKERFNKDLEAARAKAGAPVIITRPVVEMPEYDIDELCRRYPSAVPVQAPVKGQMLWQYDVDDASSAPVAGSQVKAGETMAYVQTYYGMEEVIPAVCGRVVAVCAKQGKQVVKGEIIAFVQNDDEL